MSKIKSFFSSVKSFVFSHKIISIIVLVAVLGLSIGAFVMFGSKKKTVNYVTQAAKLSDISVSVSGTGQVSSLKSVSITSKVSGDLLSVNVKNGDTVKSGDVLFKIDNTEGLKTLKSAQLALESAQLKLEQLKEPADELTLFQAENSLVQAQQTKTTAENNLAKSYDDGFNTVSNAFLDMPSIMTGIYDILFSASITQSTEGSASQANIYYYSDAASSYNSKIASDAKSLSTIYTETKALYDKNFSDYKNTSRSSSKEDIEALISETYDTTKKISDTIKSASNYIQLYEDTLNDRHMTPISFADTHLSTLNGYTSKVNTHLSNVLSARTNIANYKESIVNADSSIKEKELSLEDVKEGTSDIDIKTQELTVEQKQADLTDAQDTLTDYSVKAPFDGIVATIDVSKGDSISSGTTLGSIVTNKKIATITLNEVDVADIKVGQKVNITFDALDGLSITGEVAEVDTVGTVSQGVVSYSVKISFDSDNDKIKPGMSITANIVVDSATGVLTVPSGAVKTRNGSNYVQVMGDDGKIQMKTVETGITDDVSVEIKSGLSEGEKVVTGTTSSSATKTTTTKKTTTNNSNQGPGAGGDMMMLTR